MPIKRSFLELPVSLDIDSLVAEYRTIPDAAWGASYWSGSHCSIDMVLLRGGTAGGPEDFSAKHVESSPILKNLPRLAELLGEEGPFGGCSHAFIFRMRPHGLTRIHRDLDPAWYDPFRVHVPLISNHGALMMSAERSLHFSVGRAWTFDNQELHGVVNGPETRVHLIFDVRGNARFDSLVRNSQHHPGQPDPANWKRCSPLPEGPSIPFVCTALSREEKEQFGAPPEGFASKIVSVSPSTAPYLSPGDVILSVDSCRADPTSDTVTDFIRTFYRAGDRPRVERHRDTKRDEVVLPALERVPIVQRLLERGLRSLGQRAYLLRARRHRAKQIASSA